MLEIIGFDYQGCSDAQTAGADRIELCADPHLGGTTPSTQLIQQVMESIKLPINVMIRPRGGDFNYTIQEHEEMLRSIDLCKSYNCSGVVYGILDENGNLDKKRLGGLLKASEGMDITYHRAFDSCASPFVMMEELIQLGVPRVLTSGQANSAWEGKDLLTELQKEFGSQIIIMPGAGVTSKTLPLINTSVKAHEYHSSAKIVDNNGLYLGVDKQEVMAMKSYLVKAEKGN